MSSRIHVHQVDDEGVRLVALADLPLDVRIDGRRVWTFWSRRDTREVGLGSFNPLRRVAWPKQMVQYLDGTARVEVAESSTLR